MVSERQLKIFDKIYRSIKKIAICLWSVFALFALDKLIRLFLEGHFGIGYEHCDWYPVVLPIYNDVVSSILLLALVFTFILFAILLARTISQGRDGSNEEKEQRKEEIKEAVREVAAESENVSPTILPIQEVYDPFTDNITEEQKKVILQLLRDLPSHKERKDEINMSIVARYLTALIELEIISKTKSANLNELRTWVEKTTDKQAPEQFRFNDAFPSTYRPGINKAKDKIKQVLKI